MTRDSLSVVALLCEILGARIRIRLVPDARLPLVLLQRPNKMVHKWTTRSSLVARTVIEDLLDTGGKQWEDIIGRVLFLNLSKR